MPYVDNKQLVLDAWKAFRTRSRDQIRPYFSPDVEWIAPDRNGTAVALGMPSGFKDRDSLMKFICEDFGRLFARDVSVEITAVIAQGEHVVVEQAFRATLFNGRTYHNSYCFVFVVRDGQIHQMREYMDTAAGNRMIFGEEKPRQLL